PALGLDQLQADLVEFGKIRRAAIRQHHAAIAAVVRLAYGGMDADLGGDAAHQQIRDAAVLQHLAEVGGVKPPLPGLSTTISPSTGVSSGMMSWPASPRIRMRPIGPGSPMRSRGVLRSIFAG